MRTNLPVTNTEYVLKDDETVVSKTDLQGNITYVNQDFIKISGFSEQELLGAPQNIVRHPDMPVEAFADFWRTIKSGKAWTGLVKNRCKNGDHYWVEANAAPILENRQIVGFTSIRVKPSRAKVAAAEQAYRAIKNGDRTLGIEEGRVVARQHLRIGGGLAGLSIKSRLVGSAWLSFALFATVALVAWMSLLPASDWQHAALIWIAAAGMMLTLSCATTFNRSIIGPLEQAMHDIDLMSTGDLSATISAHGAAELGRLAQALRILQINIKLLVGQIKDATALVSDGAQAIAHDNVDLSARTEAQASALEETASSMEQLTAAVRQNAEHAQEADRLVRSTASLAQRGGEVVGQVVRTMGAIKESSHKVVDIISVIDGIAFQTNILALNAAVEAARAGEQGRGFAVVASEVRNLAQRSAAAAGEIKTLITDSVEQVERGSALVNGAGTTMGEIVVGVERVAAIMGDISTASREQSSGIEQVNLAVAQMDQVTQSNAELVERAGAAATSLQQQSGKLSQLIDEFQLVAERPAPAAARPAKGAAPRAPRPALTKLAPVLGRQTVGSL